MERQITGFSVLCKKCGARAAMWKRPDVKNEEYELTCISCDETTGWVSSISLALDNWNAGKTHPSEPFIAK